MITQNAKSSWQVVLRVVSPTRTRRRLAPPLQVESLEGRNLLSAGAWTPLSAPAPVGTMLLLSDGSVMAQMGSPTFPSAAWDELNPGPNGKYKDGSWAQLQPMHVKRLYYASDVLSESNVLILGGEYSSLGSDTNTGELYDTTLKTWKTITPFPLPQIGDAPSEVLSKNQVLVGYYPGKKVSHPCTY